MHAKGDPVAIDGETVSALTLPGDNGTWGIGIITSSRDTEARDDIKWAHPTIVYDLYCTEYCGTRHSWMWSKVVVHPSTAGA